MSNIKDYTKAGFNQFYEREADLKRELRDVPQEQQLSVQDTDVAYINQQVQALNANNSRTNWIRLNEKNITFKGNDSIAPDRISVDFTNNPNGTGIDDFVLAGLPNLTKQYKKIFEPGDYIRLVSGTREEYFIVWKTANVTANNGEVWFQKLQENNGGSYGNDTAFFYSRELAIEEISNTGEYNFKVRYATTPSVPGGNNTAVSSSLFYQVIKNTVIINGFFNGALGTATDSDTKLMIDLPIYIDSDIETLLSLHTAKDFEQTGDFGKFNLSLDSVNPFISLNYGLRSLRFSRLDGTTLYNQTVDIRFSLALVISS